MNKNILQIEQHERVMLCTISRPEALNALNNQFFDEFNLLLDDLEKNDPAGKVLVITGAGKAFVAGADIAEMQHMNQDEARAFSHKGQQAFARLSKLPFPVIAAINGYALGGGCELALACDIRLAGSKAVFGMPEVKLGLIPGYGGTQRLPRLIGQGNALYMLTTGESVNAEEALRMGLVQKVFSQEGLIDEALKIAHIISKQGPDAVSKTKNLILEGSKRSLEDGISMENQYFPELFITDGPEGIRAFLEKRKPDWSSNE